MRRFFSAKQKQWIRKKEEKEGRVPIGTIPARESIAFVPFKGSDRIYNIINFRGLVKYHI